MHQILNGQAECKEGLRGQTTEVDHHFILIYSSGLRIQWIRDSQSRMELENKKPRKALPCAVLHG